MKKIKSFKNFENKSINESCGCESMQGEINLYRLTSHPIVNLSEPGEYYVCDEDSVDPNLLDNNEGDLFLICVKTNSDNIDIEKSKIECERLGNDCIVAVKDDSLCKVESVNPYNYDEVISKQG